MALPSWSELLEKMRPELKGMGATNANRRRGAAEFVEWAEKEHVPLDGDEQTVLSAFEKTLEVHRRKNGTLSKPGEAAMAMAKELMGRARRYFEPPTKEEQEDPEPQQDEPEQEPTDMAKRPDEQMEEQMDEQFEEEPVDEDTELLSEEEEVEEEPQPPPRRRRPAPVQVQYVQPVQRARRGPPVEKAAPRSKAVSGILPRPEKIRLYKRNEMGKREIIDDFTVDEIGDLKLEQFIREYIDPQFSNDGMDTEYIAYELDSRTGKEKQPPSSITIRGSGEQQQSNDPINAVRRTMSLLQEMQGMTQQPQVPQQKNPMLEMAQQRAAQTGDVTSMMMLMMMERFMGASSQPAKPNEDLILKILDRLERIERGEPRPPPGPTFGGPPGFAGPPGFNPFPPPPMYGPPPRVIEREDRGTDKLLDLAMAKLAQPPPSLADSVKELMALQTIMQPRKDDSSEVAALRAELRAMTEKLSPKGGNSLEDSLATFEKLTTIAKSVTQQTGGGDTGGFLKNLITPEVGKVIAGIVAAQAGAAAGAPQQPVQHTPPPQPVQQVAPPPRNPNAPPQPPPKEVADAVKLFQFAQTPEVQAQRFVDVVFAMYTSQDPFYVNLLTPALEDLNKAEQSVDFLKRPRWLALMLVKDMVPRLATPDFVDACLAAMANKAGVEKLPDTLLSTRGKWTVKGNEVVMLEDVGAKPVVNDPAPHVPPAEPVKEEQPVPSSPASIAAAAASATIEKEPAVIDVTPVQLTQVVPAA